MSVFFISCWHQCRPLRTHPVVECLHGGDAAVKTTIFLTRTFTELRQIKASLYLQYMRYAVMWDEHV